MYIAIAFSLEKRGLSILGADNNEHKARMYFKYLDDVYQNNSYKTRVLLQIDGNADIKQTLNKWLSSVDASSNVDNLVNNKILGVDRYDGVLKLPKNPKGIYGFCALPEGLAFAYSERAKAPPKNLPTPNIILPLESHLFDKLYEWLKQTCKTQPKTAAEKCAEIATYATPELKFILVAYFFEFYDRYGSQLTREIHEYTVHPN